MSLPDGYFFVYKTLKMPVLFNIQNNIVLTLNSDTFLKYCMEGKGGYSARVSHLG